MCTLLPVQVSRAAYAAASFKAYKHLFAAGEMEVGGTITSGMGWVGYV